MLIERINRIFILALCFFVLPIRGRANKKQSSYSNILIIPSGKLGDIVCATPVLYAVRQKFPEAKIFVLGNKMVKAILGNSGLVDVYIDDESFIRNILKIRKSKIDFGLTNGSGFMKLAELYLSGIPLISAPIVVNDNIIQETKPYKLLSKFAVRTDFISGDYMPRQYLSLLEPVDIFEDKTEKHLGFSKKAEEKILKFLQDKNLDSKTDLIVGISPSAGNKIKLWKAERFAQIADYLYQRYNAKIVIIGGKGDIKETEEMLKYMNKDTFSVDTTGVFNIDELKGLVSKLSLFVSVDTGPIYISEAFNVPTIDIVGPVDENCQPPIGAFHKIVKWDKRENPAMTALTMRNYNYKEARAQTDNITVEMVIEKIDELILFINKKSPNKKDFVG
mgnify:FL=1|jgi:ADP-heptose:LPS heptosyltransferase